MKKIVFMLIFIFGFSVLGVYAQSEINLYEEFSDSSDISRWKYTKRMWQTVPSVENGCLNLLFTGKKTASNHLVTHTFDSAYNVEGENNVVFEMKVRFNENVCLADSFPSIVGGAYDGKIENDEGSYVYKITDANNEKVRVGEINPNTEYLITAKINFVSKTRNVYLKNIETGDVQKAEDVKYSNDVTSIQQIKILGYVEDESRPANVEIDYVRIYRDSFEILSSTIEDGSENVPSDAEFSFSTSKDILEQSIGNGMETTDDVVSGIRVECSEFIPYYVFLKDDKRTVSVSFPTGLRYGAEYKIVIPDTVKSISGDSIKEKSITFTVEKKPKRCEELSVFDIDGKLLDMNSINQNSKIKLTARLVNNSGIVDNIELLVVIYDSNGNFIRVQTFPIIVQEGEEEYTSEIDLNGLENERISIKTFFISKLKGVQTVY